MKYFKLIPYLILSCEEEIQQISSSLHEITSYVFLYDEFLTYASLPLVPQLTSLLLSNWYW